MMSRLLVLLGCLLPLALSISVSTHLSASDRARFSTIFSASLTSTSDTASLHYAILGSSLLGDAVPNTGALCAQLGGSSAETNVETLFQASTAALSLGCPLTLSPEATTAVTANLAEGATTASIYFAAKTQVSVGSKLDSAAVLKALTKAVKKDDSLLSLGLAFHTAALLEGDLSKFFDRIEDAVVQADEVDGKLLQFEGGLSVTSVVLTGAANLATKAKKKLPVTGEQAVKFANYLMSRKSVQQIKGIFHLLEAVFTMAANPQHVPLSVSLSSAVSVSAAESNVVVSVTDLAGGSPGPMTLVLDTATRLEDGAVVAAKQPLVHMVTTDKYTVDLMAANPPAGFYELVLSANPVKPDPRFVGNTGVVITVKVLATIEVTDVELRVTDSENGGRGKVHELTFPNAAGPAIPVDHKEHMSLSYSILDSKSRRPLSVHQAFVCLTHVESGAEIHYVAEVGSDGNYKFELDLNTAAVDFNSKAGDYSVSLVLGDAVISNPTVWVAATVNINFPESEDAPAGSIYESRPEITHTFREPEARPATIVSNAFTLLCLSPFLVMLILWARLGANLSNLPLSLSALGFHLGLGSIFGLYALFWLQLNMFQTVKYLVVLGVVTFLCGNSLLSGIAKKKIGA
jgi:oligosaccharyltransferase complex subunit delta (ribophorin II)